MQKIGEGWRGEVYLKEENGKKIAIKRAKDVTTQAAINKEIQILQKLNKADIKFVPQIINSSIGYFSYYYIEGEPFHQIYAKADQKIKKILIYKLLSQAYMLDTLGIIHGELAKPTKNILVDKMRNVYFIDFERGKLGDFSGKNLRSLSQWLKSQGILNIEQLLQIGKLDNVDSTYEYLLNITKNTIIKVNNNKISLILIIIIFIIIDQITKIFCYQNPILEPLIFITSLFNKGIVWGILLNFKIIYVITGLAIIYLVFLYWKRYISNLEFAFIISGILGNYIDRAMLGGVRDFIDLQYWPVFNVADIYICLGVIIILGKEFIAE